MTPKGKPYPREKCYKVTKLILNKFRRFEQQTVHIGSNITLIVGQNGTSKSTLLGLIAHPFSTKSDEKSVYVRHYGTALEGIKTINNKDFETDYRQMFRMEKDFDSAGNHYYTIYLTGPDLLDCDGTKQVCIPVRSRLRSITRNQVRLVAGKGHKQGEGNFPHPVIYLGLGRLVPLAECQKMSIEKAEEVLSREESEWLHRKNAQILSIQEKPIGVDILNSGLAGKGAFPASSYKDYNPATYSAGQDNLGQILISLLSFRRLKNMLGDKYAGGILFVDELDAALFPSAQTRLLDVLAEESELLGLQIIATTHSVTMMYHAFHSKIKSYAEVVFLRRINDKVLVEKDVTYPKIKSNLLIKYNPGEMPALFFEDMLATVFFNVITDNLFSDDYEFICIGSSGVLENLATIEKLHKHLVGICVLDADRRRKNQRKNIVYLPGSQRPLETEIYFFLKELPDDDIFWNLDKEFTKQLLFNDHQYGENEKANKYIKIWFNNQNFPEWGENGIHAISRWCFFHKELCRNFCEELIKSLRITLSSAPKLDEIEQRLKAKYSEDPTFLENKNSLIDSLPLFEHALRGNDL